MITKMKKLTFLVYHKEYEAFLDKIRELGVIHIAEKQHGEMPAELQEYLQKRNSYKNLLQQMQKFSVGTLQNDSVNSEDTLVAADVLIAKFEALQSRIQELNQQRITLEKESEVMALWGDFEWEQVYKIESAGWNIQFYTCSEKEFKQEWCESYNAIVINECKGQLCFVTVTHGVVQLDIEPVRLPKLSLKELEKKRTELINEEDAVRADLAKFCSKYSIVMEKHYMMLQSDIDLLKVKLNSEAMAEGAVVMLEGFVPEESEAAVQEYLHQSGVYYEIRKVTREDNAPVKLKNNAFVRMYEVLTKMYGMPSFADFDPTPIVAPFFSLFFAFCMGDAGYGLILIALGFFLKHRMGKDMQGMMNLVITLGIFTTVVGAILGTFFGISLIDTNLPQNLKNMMLVGNVDFMGSTYNVQMLLALAIGVVHISLAMTVKAINSTVFYGFKESLSVWGWWLFIVGSVVIGTLTFLNVMPANVSQWAFMTVGGVGAIGIYLLNNLRRNVFMNIGAGLWDTYNMASGLLGDVLSYIRLFALGLAGGMLGQTFNNLALMCVDGQDGSGSLFGWIGFALIIVFGHVLNIAMSCLSAFVHPLRLTFVEYFKNAGYEGKGTEYKPFKKNE